MDHSRGSFQAARRECPEKRDLEFRRAPTPSDLRLRFFHHVSLVAVMVGRGSEADHWAWGRLVSGHLSAAGLQAADLFY
jgi:hypothetical protein